MAVVVSTSVVDPSDENSSLVVARDAKSRKIWDSNSKIVKCLEKAGDRGVSFQDVCNATRLSSRTVSKRLPTLATPFRDPVSARKLWRLRENVPVPMATFTTSLSGEPDSGLYPKIIEYHKGHLRLTREAREGLNGMSLRKFVPLLNATIWDGVRAKRPVEFLGPLDPRDPHTGKRLRKGAGNCPVCHTGTMREIHPSPYWHCTNCGINRGGSFSPSAREVI